MVSEPMFSIVATLLAPGWALARPAQPATSKTHSKRRRVGAGIGAIITCRPRFNKAFVSCAASGYNVGMDKIVVEHLDFFYNGAQALRDISLSIPDRRITALIGPSGCGKSTFLRCLNRMNDTIAGARATGKVLLDGVDVLSPAQDVVDLRRRVGLVFQKPNPFPQSIYDNVAFGPRALKMNLLSLDDALEQSLRGAALWDEVKDKLKTPALELSLGEQQRLCIARVLAVQPEVILMDEPCSALDPIATLRIEDLMQQLKQNYTIVIVTHNMQQAARVSDFTGFFWLGELVEHGPTEELFVRPKHSQTEKYVTGKFG
jgi:phosphate transport system ATP-binding protein